jgi:hypothetical protein
MYTTQLCRWPDGGIASRTTCSSNPPKQSYLHLATTWLLLLRTCWPLMLHLLSVCQQHPANHRNLTSNAASVKKITRYCWSECWCGSTRLKWLASFYVEFPLLSSTCLSFSLFHRSEEGKRSEFLEFGSNSGGVKQENGLGGGSHDSQNYVYQPLIVAILASKCKSFFPSVEGKPKFECFPLSWMSLGDRLVFLFFLSSV